MIGFNGGLIGVANPAQALNSLPGVWTAREQEVASRTGSWAGTGFLDIYPGATAAYSLRVLRGARSSSPVVQVRRSSDGQLSDFTAIQVTNGTLTSFCGAGNGFVRTWYDQSTQLNNAVQTTDALQPRIVNAGVLDTTGGKPAVVFGTQSLSVTMLPISPITNATTCCFFFVTAHNNSTGNWSWIVGERGGQGQFFIGKRSGSSTAHTSLAGDISNTNIAQRSVSYWQLGTGISAYQINNSFATLSNWTSGSAWQLGTRNGSEGWNGPMQEFIYYPSSQVSSKNAIISNLNTYYTVF
jgi:hypothetical protein